MRLLTFTLAVIVAVVFAGVVLHREINQKKTQIEQLENAARLLCRRKLITIDLVNAALILVNQRLEADSRRGDAEAMDADKKFINTFKRDRRLLIRDLTSPASPCLTIRR